MNFFVIFVIIAKPKYHYFNTMSQARALYFSVSGPARWVTLTDAEKAFDSICRETIFLKNEESEDELTRTFLVLWVDECGLLKRLPQNEPLKELYFAVGDVYAVKYIEKEHEEDEDKYATSENEDDWENRGDYSIKFMEPNVDELVDALVTRDRQVRGRYCGQCFSRNMLLECSCKRTYYCMEKECKAQHMAAHAYVHEGTIFVANT